MHGEAVFGFSFLSGDFMTAFMNFFEKILKALVITANGLMLLLVFGQVITRYCFSYTPEWGEELSRYLFVWVVFLSMPLVAKSGGHMAIETITSRLHGNTLRLFRLLAHIFTAVFLAAMVYNGYMLCDRASFQTSPAMQVPMSWVYSVIPFGCAVMLLYTLQSFIQLLRVSADEVK